MRNIFIIIGLAFSFHGFCEVENPISAATERDYQATDEKWEEFESILSWYLESEKPELIHASNEEEEVLAAFFNEKWSEEHAHLEETLQELNGQFLDFREELSEALSLRETGVTGAALRASVVKEVTECYVSIVEEYLLPSSWKNAYTTYMENKKNDASIAKEDEL